MHWLWLLGNDALVGNSTLWHCHPDERFQANEFWYTEKCIQKCHWHWLFLWDALGVFDLFSAMKSAGCFHCSCLNTLGSLSLQFWNPRCSLHQKLMSCQREQSVSQVTAKRSRTIKSFSPHICIPFLSWPRQQTTSHKASNLPGISDTERLLMAVWYSWFWR